MNYNRNLTGIVIDPGHGGEDSGAVGNGIVEKNLTFLISEYMYNRFKELGVPVELTRTGDYNLTSSNRPDVALSKFGNDKDVIIISNHINAGGGEGAEVIYALRNDETLSNKILNELSKKGQVIRKYYQRGLPTDSSKDYYYMLRNTPNTEAVIIEYGFLDNVKDANRLKTNYKDYADAVIEVILDYKNIPFVEQEYYTVKKGDSLWSIAKRFNTTVDILKEINNLKSNTLSIGQKLKIKKNEVIIEPEIDIIIPQEKYVVKKGDTLYSIAKTYDVSIKDLKDFNNLVDNTLSIGQELIIPSKEINTTNIDIKPIEYDYYTVKKGDTLYKIANINSVTVNDLKNVNNLDSNILSIGQLLKVPKNNNIYTVMPGDTLYSIAGKNNITVNKLKEINNLINNNISIGQQLLIK